ncbi:MBL fold metallo-hydrolase [Bacteroidia bacterium]|nr:MBL fold metallo-hydrolase [Bacteroidia bacterium]MDB9882110.1 MBL fold metallo-hydrolase [Bacteroidia bacterium]
MKVTFLGTGTSQGVPIIACDCEVCKSDDPRDKRLRSSVLIETEHTNIVIDTGPDFRQQMLREKVQKVDAIVFTHGHKDHTAGFDDIRGFNWKTKTEMDVYANEEVEVVLKRDFYYAFAENKYPGVPNLYLHVIHNEKFMIRDLEVQPIEVLHYKLPVFGYRIGDFSYITDANYISEEEKIKLRGSKVLVLNALRKTDHISHFTLDQAVALAQEIDADQTYIIHMSHQMGFHEEVDSELPSGINLAYDELQVLVE